MACGSSSQASPRQRQLTRSHSRVAPRHRSYSRACPLAAAARAREPDLLPWLRPSSGQAFPQRWQPWRAAARASPSAMSLLFASPVVCCIRERLRTRRPVCARRCRPGTAGLSVLLAAMALLWVLGTVQDCRHAQLVARCTSAPVAAGSCYRRACRCLSCQEPAVPSQ